MKAFIAGVTTLLILTTAVICNAVFIHRHTDEMLELLLSLPDQPCSAEAEAVLQLWESERFYFSLTVGEKALDAVDDAVFLLSTEARDIGGDCAYARDRLIHLLCRLQRTEGISLEHIF